MIKLEKSTGINLSKGSIISLKKEEQPLENICVGLDWGKIKKKNFGLFTTEHNVDLDASAALFDALGRKVDLVFFNRLTSQDGAMRHSGDDRVGDSTADGLDNEVISLQLSKISRNIHTIVFFLNSYNQQDFETIPYSKIRIYEGNRRKVNSVFATFNLSADKAYAGRVAMIMAKLIREEKGWKFETLGEPSDTRKLMETVDEIAQKYV